MHRFDGYDIEVTRGDTLFFALNLTGRDLPEGSVAYFTIKSSPRSDEILVQKKLDAADETMEVRLTSADTDLKPRTYYWDVRVLIPLAEGGYEVETPMDYAAFTILEAVGDPGDAAETPGMDADLPVLSILVRQTRALLDEVQHSLDTGAFVGEQGPQGETGIQGPSGVSPTIQVSKEGKTATLTITDAEGVKTVELHDGESGGVPEGGQAGQMLTADENGAAVWENRLNFVNGSLTGAVRTSGAQEEDDTYTMGMFAHAQGQWCKAAGYAAHAEGLRSSAAGGRAHAEGVDCVASGDQSHAEGYMTHAVSANQHVQGKFNADDTEGRYAHIVGNGTDGYRRSNIHTVGWDGSAWFKGKVYVGGTSQDDAEELGVGQTDWNAQEGEAGYVKNRTHWSVKTEQDILKDYVMTADDNGDMYISQLFELAGGETYTVTWNGTAYQCTAQKFEENGQSMVMVGNIAAVDGSGDTGEPFVLASTDLYAASGVYGMAMPLDGSASATVSIRGNVETVGELDSKYIQTSLYNAVKNCVKPYEPGAVGIGDMVVCEDWFPDGTIAWGRCTAHDVVYKAFPNANTNCALTFNSSGNFAATGEFFTLNARGYVDGIILRSPDLTRWKIGVSDDGTLTATAL